MEEIIKTWIENPDRDYHAGISLLEQHSSGKMTLVFNLRRIKTSTNVQILEYELRKLAGMPEEDPKPVVIPAPAADKKNSDLLQGLLDQRAAKYAARAEISDTLADLTGEKNRAKLASATEACIKLDEEIIALTTQIQYVESHGRLPVPKAEKEEDHASLTKKRKTLGERKSRIIADLKKTPGNLKKEAKLAETDAEIQKVDLQLKALSQT